MKLGVFFGFANSERGHGAGLVRSLRNLGSLRSALSVFRFPFSVLRAWSRRRLSGGAVYDCFIGAGVPPFMGALPLVALWGALSALSSQFSALSSQFSVLSSQLSVLSFPFSALRFPF